MTSSFSNIRSRAFAVVILSMLLVAGCTTSQRDQKIAAAAAQVSQPDLPTRTVQQESLYESRLLKVVEQQQQLMERISDPDGPVNDPEIERQFRMLDNAYVLLIEENPGHLHTRLLYGKLLDFFGDREGAYLQFTYVYDRNPSIGVVNQQIATFLAEDDRPTESLVFLLRAIELEPEVGIYYFQLGDLIHVFFDRLVEAKVGEPEVLQRQMFEAFASAAQKEPDNIAFQMRYGESFYDIPEPDWSSALAHWNQIAQMPSLGAIELDAVRIHLSRCLLELDRVEEARSIASLVSHPGLTPSRDALLAAFNPSQPER